MALSAEQKSGRLFKKSFGLAEAKQSWAFSQEGYVGQQTVLPSQIWAEAEDIPATAPTLINEEISGVVQYYEKLELIPIDGGVEGGRQVSYYHENLKNALDFTFDGSYNYLLYKNDGTTQVYDGVGDWLVDREAGVLMFYNSNGDMPSGIDAANPPKISFYKYVGDTGIGGSGAGSGIIVKDPVRAASTVDIANYDVVLKGFTSLPSDIDGVSDFNEGDRFLVKEQTDKVQNGIYSVFGTTLVRAVDHDGNPEGEVRINNYVFTTEGLTNIAKSWILSDSDAEEAEENIIPGENTQVWKLFAESKTYQASGEAIKLNGDTFELDILSGDSALSQSVDGLTVNVDDNTIKIVDNELRTPVRWNQVSTTVDISGGTAQITDLALDYDPVDYVSAYVNGVEYLVSFTGSKPHHPFYYNEMPIAGTIISFDVDVAGFGIESGTDVVMIKYNYIDMTV